MNSPTLGAPRPNFGQGAPPTADDPDLGQYQQLIAGTEQTVNIPTTTTSKLLWPAACVLLGWSLRETTGTAAAVIEFMDGADANSAPVAEQTIVSPVSALGLNTDVDIDASSATPAAANNVTLAGVAGATTFITGFEISGLGATAAATLLVTVTGILGGAKTYVVLVPAGVGVEINRLLVEFSRPIPASAANTAITVNVPTPGAGNTAFAVTAHGFQRTATAAAAAVAGTATATVPGAGALLRSGLFLRVIQGSVTGAVWLRI